MSSVLIVEDDAVLREILFELFAKEHVCCAASTAERALALLSENQFDVVLTDISMPGMSGLELLGHVRQRWPKTAVIIISGIRDQEYANGLIKMGASDFLMKPFQLADVKRSVACTINQHRSPVELPAHDPTVDDKDEMADERAAVFSAIQLGEVFSLPELLTMAQRGRMNGCVELRWNDATVEVALRTGIFQNAAGEFDEAVRRCRGWIYLRDGLMVDAVLGEQEENPYPCDAERSLLTMVRLATWAGVGMRAWGYAVSESSRPARLSVSDNSSKLFNIITSDEEARVAATWG
jgi:DNA-binding response OmpR family regulator